MSQRLNIGLSFSIDSVDGVVGRRGDAWRTLVRLPRLIRMTEIVLISCASLLSCCFFSQRIVN